MEKQRIATLPKSEILSFEWTGNRIPYPETHKKGDCFPITWSDDDHLYTSSGDPLWTAFEKKKEVYKKVYKSEFASSVFANSGLDFERITGLPPHYKVHKVNDMLHFVGWGDEGPKPTGVISVAGVLYLAMTGIGGARLPPPDGLKHLVAVDGCIICSSDKGETWNADGLTPEELPKRIKPIFPGWKFGGPVFVQFGKDNAEAPDKYVYAISSTTWDNGSELRVGRVPQNRILDRSEWRWVTGFSAENVPIWTDNDEEACPVLSVKRSISCPEMVYLKHLKRYLLLTFRLHEERQPHGTDLLIFESPTVWGPFRMVYFESPWESITVNPYTPRLPLKWFDPKTNKGWILYSGNWHKTGPPDLLYRSHVRPFQLIVKDRANWADWPIS